MSANYVLLGGDEASSERDIVAKRGVHAQGMSVGFYLTSCLEAESTVVHSQFITVVFLELAVAVTVTISSLCLARRCFERVLNGFSLKGSENSNLHHAAIYLTVATLRAQARNQVRRCVSQLAIPLAVLLVVPLTVLLVVLLASLSQFCSPCCSKNLWPKAIVLIITPPPIDEVARLQYPYTDNPQGVPERTNEAAGEYARACTAVAAECGVPVIDLWTKMQQCPDWKKEYLRYSLCL
ncbi:GDSL esterase/lipase [Arachis hypogaea]|nr:GDSL esterase/lipase [Arachis hypogaea]